MIRPATEVEDCDDQISRAQGKYICTKKSCRIDIIVLALGKLRCPLYSYIYMPEPLFEPFDLHCCCQASDENQKNR